MQYACAQGLTLFLIVVCTNSIFGQLISGKVVDQNEDPLPGVNIYLKNDLLNGTSTDIDGKFELAINDPEDTLIFTFIGYNGKKLPIKNAQQPLKIKLTPGQTAMPEIVVSDQRLIAEEFNQQKINKMDIYTNPAAKADPLLAVNALPAATNLDESANVRLRGGLPQETSIFLDGVPVYDAIRYGQLNGLGTFSIFNTAIVDEVRVFPGAAPLEYGSNTSGLVAISSENQISTQSYTDVLLSLASLGINHRQPIGKHTGIRFFSNYQPSALFTNLNRQALEDLQRFNSIDAGLQLTSLLNDGWQMKLFNYTNDEGYQFKVQQAGEKNIVDQNKTRNLTTFNLSKSYKHLTLNYNQGLSFSRQIFNYKRSNTTIDKQTSFSSISAHQINETNEWKAGINLDLQFQQFSSLDYVKPYATRTEHPMININDESSITQLELYLYHKRDLGKRVQLGSGVSINQLGKIGSNLMLNYNINEHHHLRFSESSARRKYLADQFINYDYEIKADNLALEYIFKVSGHELSVSGFYHRKEYAGDEVKLTGLELYHQLSWSQLDLNWSFSLLNYREGIQEHRALKEELVDLDYFFRAAINWNITTNLQLGMNTIYRQGGVYLPVENGGYDFELQVYEPVISNDPQRLNDYFVVDLNLSNRFMLFERWPVIAFVSASNLLNKKNVRDYQYDFSYENPQPVYFGQRVFYAGINLILGSE